MSKSLAFTGLTCLLLLGVAMPAWAAAEPGTRVGDPLAARPVSTAIPLAPVMAVAQTLPAALAPVAQYNAPVATPVTAAGSNPLGRTMPAEASTPLVPAIAEPVVPEPTVEDIKTAPVMPAIAGAPKESKFGMVERPLLAAAIAPSSDTQPIPTGDFDGDQPMNVAANEMIYEQNLDKVTAQGNVVIEQEGRVLTADKVSYFLKDDKAFAEGNVVLKDANGDVHNADRMEMTDSFKNGFVAGLSSILNDGSRLVAKEGERINANKIVLKDAWYTPCKPCQKDPAKTPDWNVVAEEVTLDQVEHRVVYKNAKFELFGVPVMYTPYLSHSDGTIKQKSGVLPPRVGYSSQIGAFADVRYYHAIDKDRDATTGVILTSREGPVAVGEYRQRFDNAEMEFGGTITQSTRPLSDDRRSEEEVRGSLNGKGLWNIDNKWRAGYKLNMASDDQYLRQYKMPREDVLENEVYVERFEERDYASVRAMAFQDTRVSRATIDQPHILPLAEIEHYSEPKAILGGRTKLGASTVGINRDGSGQDMQRFSGEAEWNKRTIIPGGVVNDTDLAFRGDMYAIQDRFTAASTPGQSRDDTVSRKFAQAHTQFGYPLARRLEEGNIILEPRAAFTTSNDIRNLNDIPNEDSQDVDFNIAELFERNRFAGYDRLDDGTRVTTGMAANYVGDSGRQGEIFFGQSYRLSDDNNPFPRGSGLEDDRSDLVGRVRYQGAGGSMFEYGSRFDEETLAARRHDMTMNLIQDPVSIAASYYYLGPLEGTDLTESQEQLMVAPSVKLSDEWYLRNQFRYDLSGDQDERGLQTASFGLDYIGDCMTFSATLERNNLDEASGTSETEIFFRVGFKNLGEIESSPISFSTRDDELASND